MDKNKVVGPFLLFVTALIWGTSFIAQEVGANDGVGSFTYQATRNALGAFTLLLVWIARELYQRKKGSYRPMTAESKRVLLRGGLGCGCLLCAATVLQQFGITAEETSPGKAAFITALYIVFVPVFSLVLKRFSPPHVYLCVAVALGGLWLLCMSGSGLMKGDLLVILCAVIFALHIILVDHVAPHVDGIKLSCVQFTVAAVISAIGMLLTEQPEMSTILRNWFPIFYSGVFSAAIAYTLQIVGQKHTQPTVACLLMSLESVFAVLTSMIMMPEQSPHGAREWIGMAVILAAIVLAQIPLKYKKGKKQN
jgi:drug/metabolite transporter (DMT)-like permease